jgi:hypothetical protein
MRTWMLREAISEAHGGRWVWTVPTGRGARSPSISPSVPLGPIAKRSERWSHRHRLLAR